MSEDQFIRHDLPSFPTPFIGRAAEIAELSHLLANPECRLLTLVGPGGIGKTRLAVEVARCLLDTFPDGVCFVPLAPLRSPENVLPAILEALRLQHALEADPRQQLFDFLRDKNLLLMLDNFEHVRSASSLVADIIRHTAYAKVLVTSREVLALPGGQEYGVEGLATPEIDANNSFETYDAMQFFAGSALQIIQDFSPSAEREAIAQICALVQGMPLALEMAASWLRVLPCRELPDILRGLDHFVSRDNSNIRAVFERSWILLNDDERRVFQRLSVFRGGFTYDAAINVADTSLLTLRALTEKSLVRLSSDRLELHELLRQFAEEKLDEAGDTHAVYSAHSAYYLDWLAAQEPNLKGGGQLTALDQIQHDIENLRAAWEWAVAQHEFDAIERALESLPWYCAMRSRYIEGVAFYQLAYKDLIAQKNKAPQTLLARLSLPLPFYGASRDAEVQAQIKRVLETARRHRYPDIEAYCLYELGIADLEQAIALLESSLAIYRDLNDQFMVGIVLQELAYPYTTNGHHQAARQASEEAIRLARQQGNDFLLAWALSAQTWAMLLAGQYAKQFRNRQKINALHEARGDTGGILLGRAQNSLWQQFMDGQFAQARREAESVLIQAREQNYPPAAHWARITLGWLACVDEDYAEARRWFDESHPEMIYIQGVRNSGMALAACGESEYQTASEMTCRVLRQALDMEGPGWMAWALIPAALIKSHLDAKAEAAQLLGLLFHTDVMTHDWLENLPLLARLQHDLSSEMGITAFTASYEKGAKMQLEKVAQKLFDDLSDLDHDPRWLANLKLNDPLTRREFEILQLMPTGYKNREMAEQLFVAEGTSRQYNSIIYSKLDVRNRTEAIARARELGLLD